MVATKEFSTVGPDSTVIGPSILISGKLTGDEDLTVRGRVEGELNLSKTLIIETSGVVKANVSVRNAIVSGVVVGNVVATESVELTREGRMVGDIRSPRVIIVDGASFRGRIDMGNAEPRPQAERPATRPVVRPAAVRPATLPARPAPQAAPARVMAPAKPQPPPVARVEARPEPRVEAKPAPPPPPPQPVLVGEAGKKKVLVKKKK
ncbi:MAG: polymer-forming cytoskeletal protein [Myxococcaceae bacterium]|nr:polymer-forming cytoskeletal protein [Myxococcaceae bacterium]